jgi:hypothetical protein
MVHSLVPFTLAVVLLLPKNTSVVTCTVSSAVRGTSVLALGLTEATYTLVFTYVTTMPSA